MQDIPQFLKDLKEAVIVQCDPQLGLAYEKAIMSTVLKLQNEIKIQQEKQQQLQQRRNGAVLDSAHEEFIEHLDEQSSDLVDHQIFLEEQMAVIAEMRLVYLYKAYEIMLKEMLQSAYGADVKALFNWHEQAKFLKQKNIDVKKIDGYIELNQLRIIVNNIKHGTTLDTDAKSVQEFKNSDQVSYKTGTEFYQRVSPAVNAYTEKLSVLIFNSCIDSL